MMMPPCLIDENIFKTIKELDRALDSESLKYFADRDEGRQELRAVAAGACGRLDVVADWHAKNTLEIRKTLETCRLALKAFDDYDWGDVTGLPEADFEFMAALVKKALYAIRWISRDLDRDQPSLPETREVAAAE